MSRRAVWTSVFLALTAAAVGMELWAANDSSPDTTTWTELITTWWPAPVTFAAIGILTTWIGPHFADAYRRRKEAPMVEPIPVPPSREADARNRAARTFWQGLLIDVTVALLVTIGPTLVGSDFTFSPDYWKTLGLLAAKTVISAGVSYLMRKLVPPQFDPPRDVAPVTDPTVPTDPPDLPGIPPSAWSPKHVGGE